MKAQVILLFLLVSLVSTKGFSNNNDVKQDGKKSVKTKYEFNIFKFVSLDTEKESTDSLKTNPATTLYIKRKED